MKKVFGVTMIAFLLLLTAFAVNVYATNIVSSGTCGSNLNWTLDSDGKLVISGTGNMSNWSYNSQVPWHTIRNNIKTVTIKSGVTSIGNDAFSECSSLTSITIPDGVTSIGGNAFSGCSSLTSITIPDSVTSIVGCAFHRCSSLTSITIPESVTSIGGSAFSGCSNLTSITIPESVTSIGGNAFSYCSSLTSINVSEYNASYSSYNGVLFNKTKTQLIQCPAEKTGDYVIPDGVTSIVNYAFSECSSLTSITISDGVTSIGNYAFSGCSSLTSITIPDGVTSIGNDTFSYCSSLTSVTIPDGVTSIGNYAFYGCSSLTSITIPDGVTSIGNDAFSCCSSLTSVTIPESITSIGSDAFYRCESLQDIYYGGSTQEWTELNYSTSANVHFAKISTGVCGGNLTFALYSRGELVISGTGNMTNYDSYHRNYAPWYEAKIKTVTIKSGVTSIGRDAFHGCSGLTSITIPEGVTSIGINAFEDCSSLTSITIPESVTSIGSSAFYECIGLTSVTIPEGVTSIGNDAFFCCSSLTSITIPDSVTNIGSSAFSCCSSLTSITIPDSVTSIGSSAFSCCNNLQDIYYGGSLSEWVKLNINTSANIHFAKTSTGVCGDNLTFTFHEDSGEFVISGTGDMTNWSNYGDTPWYSIRNYIKTVTIEDGVTSIGDYAFSSCSSLTSITIPERVTSIGNYAFSGCGGLTSITIPGSVKSIGSDAFSSCRSLTSITIPEGVKSIGSDAFSGCSNLISITIPESVISIGYHAFYYCNSLQDIYYGGSLFEWVKLNINTSINVHCAKEGTGVCGDNLTFALYDTGELVISGKGDMTNWSNYGDVPWYAVRNNIKTVTIEDGATSIGDYAFRDCDSLTSITIPDSVSSIGDDAFHSCSSLTSITIPESVTSIGSSAFCGCSSLASITIPESVTIIDMCAFSYCSVLTSITIPKGVTSIGTNAFHSCSSLTSVTIPDSVTTIGYGAFGYCSSLTSITIPDSVTSIGNYAFSGCSSLQNIYYGGSEIEWMKSNPQTNASVHFAKGNTGICGDNVTFTFYKDSGELVISGTGNMLNWSYESQVPWYVARNYIKTVTVESGVTSIGSYAFYDCQNLTDIYISESVTDIPIADSFGSVVGYKSSIISDCINLSSINVNSSNTKYSSENGVLFNKDKTTLLLCPQGKSGVYSVPQTVTHIEKVAFRDCKNISKIVIPNGLKTIGNNAFDGCIYVSSVNIPEGVTDIGSYAFRSCEKLKSITIPSTVQTIKNSIFNGCSSLTSITIREGVTGISSGAFANCSNLEYIKMPNSVISIGSSVFYGCSSLTNMAIPNGVTIIENGVFSSCTNLERIAIPETVKSIKDDAFYNCTQLSNISYGGTKDQWGDITIGKNNSRLYNVTIYYNQDNFFNNSCGETLKYTLYESGELLISGTGDMSDWTISDAVPWYEDRKAIKTITIGDGVTSIGANAFYGCDVEKISIPDSVTVIKSSAFNECKKLKEVFYGNIISKWNTISVGTGNQTLINAEIHGISSGLSGKYGNDSVWTMYDDGTLIISGFGAMEDCYLTDHGISGPASTRPWDSFEGDIKRVIIGSAVTRIGDRAFAGCNNITSVIIPYGVNRIGCRAFANCSSLKEIIIPNSVEYINFGAFANCSSLTTIDIPNSVVCLEEQTFRECINLQKVYWDANCSITPFDSGGTNIAPVDYSGAGSKTIFSGAGNNMEVVFGDNVTALADNMFRGCSGIKNIILPNTVTCIGENTFYNIGHFTIYFAGTPDEWEKVEKMDDFVRYDYGTEYFYKYIEPEWTNNVTIIYGDYAESNILNESMSDATYSCEIYFDNDFTEQTATAILAFYDGQGRLVQLKSKEIEIKPGKVDLEIDFEKKPYSRYRLMIWDDLISMKPLLNIR